MTEWKGMDSGTGVGWYYGVQGGLVKTLSGWVAGVGAI